MILSAFRKDLISRVFRLDRSVPILSRIAGFWRDEDGATMVEYALMVSLISLALITSVTLMTRAFSGSLGGLDQGLSPGQMSETTEARKKPPPRRPWGF